MNMSNRFFILKGKEAISITDPMEWGKWFENTKDRVVKQETLGNGKLVSTVFFGLNYNFGEGEPILFETMVFPSKDNRDELDVERYSTYDEAEAGHKRMVEKWSK